MIDLRKYVNNDEDFNFLQEIAYDLGPECLSEVELSYKGCKLFSIEPIDNKYIVLGFGAPIEFAKIEDLFMHLLIEGKSFIEQVADIDYA